MSAPAPSEDLDLRPTSLSGVGSEYRYLFKAHIVVHKLMIIGVLILLPLLAWHIAMTQVFEKYDMPRMWDQDFRDVQMSASKVWVWVLMWIFVPVDLVHAILALGWHHGILHPSRQNTRDLTEGDVSQNDTSGRDTSGQDATHQKGTWETIQEGYMAALSSAQYQVFFLVTSAYRGTKSLPHRLHHGLWAPPHRKRNTPRTCHPFLHRNVPSEYGFLLLIAYDLLLVCILAAHACSYMINIHSVKLLCDPDSPLLNNETFERYKERGFVTQPLEKDLEVLDFKQRCNRLNWFIHIAGGFASALAVILAYMHLATLSLRVCELGLEHVDRKQDQTAGKEDAAWQHAPRDIDIHTCAALARATEGRLSRISEEEHSTGGGAVRRRHTTRTGGSARWVSREEADGQRRLEGVLLECLL